MPSAQRNAFHIVPFSLCFTIRLGVADWLAETPHLVPAGVRPPAGAAQPPERRPQPRGHLRVSPSHLDGFLKDTSVAHQSALDSPEGRRERQQSRDTMISLKLLKHLAGCAVEKRWREEPEHSV